MYRCLLLFMRMFRQLHARALRGNITGNASMVAYNLLLSIFPFLLLLLFVVSFFSDVDWVNTRIVDGASSLFPSLAGSEVRKTLETLQGQRSGLGIVALLAGVWASTNFWSALDFSFSKLYDMPSRRWLHQKRFAFKMVGLQTLLVFAVIVLPTIQGVLIAGIGNSVWNGVITLTLTMSILFLVCCLIYRFVPSQTLSWGHIWPGALLAVLGIAIINIAFPLYLKNISTIGTLGGSVGFMLVVLLWFYFVSAMLLLGALLNSQLHSQEQPVTPFVDGWQLLYPQDDTPLFPYPEDLLPPPEWPQEDNQ